MKLTITVCLPWLLLAQACSLGETEDLEVEMYGVAKAKDGVTGTRDPSYQIWRLKSVQVTPSSGEALNFEFATDGIPFRIVDRPQLIFQQDFSKYVGVSFDKLDLLFDAQVIGGDRKVTDLSYTLTNPTVTLTGPFTVKKARKLSVHFELDWANSLSDETLEEPGQSIAIP